MPRIQAHTHKLKRHKYKTTGHSVFFCVLDCGFKVDTGLALGKKTVCWVCGGETTLNEYSIRLAKPRCMSCVKHKNQPMAQVTNEVIEATAIQSTSDLRSRLSGTFQQAQPDEEI